MTKCDRVRRVLTVTLLLVCGAFAGEREAAAVELKDHPVVSRYPGSTLVVRDDAGFSAYNFVVGVNAKAKTDAEALNVRAVEGDVTRLAYENPREKSAHEIFTNYKEGLKAGGFEILFSCEGSACGPSSASSRWGRMTGLRYFSPDMRYLAAKHARGGHDVYVAVLVAKLRHQVEIVEATAMQRGLVTAKGIADGLMLNGRAVLDGIFFDTDKATIKPESKPAIEVIAKFLSDHSTLNVYIVGHTDSVGGLDYNMNLSRNRAAAVVEILIKNHGIAAARLSAHGVGPLSPDNSNRTEDGKGSNRRVEMVEQ